MPASVAVMTAAAAATLIWVQARGRLIMTRVDLTAAAFNGRDLARRLVGSKTHIAAPFFTPAVRIRLLTELRAT